MDDTYNSNGIALKTWFATSLICFQVAVHHPDSCFTCKDRVSFVKEKLVIQNVQCFWTRQPDDGTLYVTVGPPPDGLSVEKYLSFLLDGPVIMESRSEEGRSKRKKSGSRNRRHIAQ
jgi:hypothetical protein